MDDLSKIIDYLWLAIQLLLLALAGVIIIMFVRVVFRLPWRRATYGTRSRPRRSEKGDIDPWKASGDRLIVPMPHPDDEDQDDNSDDADR